MLSNIVDDPAIFPVNEKAIKFAQEANQLATDGKIAEAILHYNEDLRLQPDNPVLLNDLAWLLAVKSPTELRNGVEATQLASKAVKLTNYRVPVFIGTLAAAYAETGQFSKAVETAQIARALASINGQQDIVASNDKLIALYAAGKKALSLDGP